MLRKLSTFSLAALTTAAAHAAPVKLIVRGHVETNNFLAGTFLGVPGDVQTGAGAATTLTVRVNSDVFVNDPYYPVRGYPFEPGALTLQVGELSIGLNPAQSNSYLCIRNNDPGVDGVFLSTTTSYPFELPLSMTPSAYGIAFSYGFNNRNVYPSLNILDCTGTHAYAQIGSYNFTVQHGEFSTPLIFVFHDFSIVRQLGVADVGSQGGVSDFDQQLDNNDFIAFIDLFFGNDPRADLGTQGGVAGQDGVLDNNDFVAFIDAFFGGGV